MNQCVSWNCESICVPPPSWNCSDNYACIEVEDGSGTFSSLEDCESICVPPPSWNCSDNYACIEVEDGSGTFSSLDDCESICFILQVGIVVIIMRV